MDKIFKKCMIFLTVSCLVLNPLLVFANESDEDSTITPIGAVYVCTGSSTNKTLKSSNNQEVYKTFGIFSEPLNSVTIEEAHVFTVSNANTFNLIPELWTYSYQETYSSSGSLAQTVTNRTGRLAEFVGFAVYDLYKVKKLVETAPGSGYCTLIEGDYKVYKGTGYGYR